MTLSNEQMERYIRDQLLPQLSLDHSSYHFELTDKGQRNAIIHLSIEGFKPLIIKGTRKKHKAEHMREGTQHLRSHGIKAPEIICVDLSRKTFKTLGYYFVCEEKIEGKICGELDDAMDSLHLVAASFSRMHAIRRTRWGRLNGGSRFGFWRYLKDNIREKLRRLSACNRLFTKEQGNLHWQWFASFKDTIKSHQRFSLSHCDFPYLHSIHVYGGVLQ